MALILSDSRRNSTAKVGIYTRPKGPLEINPHHPQAKWLIAYFIATPTGLLNLVTGENIELSNPADIKPNRVGNMAVYYNGGSSETPLVSNIQLPSSAYYRYMFSAGVEIGSAVGASAACLIANSSNSYTGFETTATNFRTVYADSTFTGNNTGFALTTDRYYFTASSTRVVFGNVWVKHGIYGTGGYQSDSVHDTSFFGSARTDWDRLFLNTGTTDYSFDHFAVWVALPSPRLTWPQYELDQYARNPMALLRPRTRKLFIVPQVAGFAQEGFRWRNDDGSESAATWAAAQDTNITEDKNITKRLRVLVNATGDPASTSFQLEVKKSTDPDSAYKKVN